MSLEILRDVQRSRWDGLMEWIFEDEEESETREGVPLGMWRALR